MPSVWTKLDPELTAIYLNFLRVREGGAAVVPKVHRVVKAGGKIHVTLRYSGDLAALEALGFQMQANHGNGLAGGIIDLADLERLAEQPSVVRLSFGRKPRPSLNLSVPQIRAKNGVWTFAAPTFTGKTGKDVVVGIIDTGIDFRHPFFLKTDAPKTTRILRIWDQGLRPTGAESSPAAALLTGSTYGVEYTDVMINKVLQGVSGATPVRHRDCGAHGTHVASIAAGDGRPSHTFIGVAPEADIIVVKYLYPEQDAEIGGAAVDDHTLFIDAVTYIRNVAKNLGKPAVINCSFGANLGPHDGFTETEIWLTTNFAGATGEVLISAAGNEAGEQNNTDGRLHVRVDFAAAGTVQIPIDLYDPRTNRRDHNRCAWLNATSSLSVQAYYPTGGSTLSAEVQLPSASGVAGFLAGPALGGAPTVQMFKGRQLTISHQIDPGVGIPDRNFVDVTLEPFRNRHLIGRYILKLTSSGALKVHVWVDYGDGYGLEIRTVPALPAFVHTDENHQISSNGGADNIITVAAYNAEIGPGFPLVDFSSRGPLATYTGGPPPRAKPDIAAPGLDIDAAKSRHIVPPEPGDHTQMSGTSMAAPHVTGAVALMFQQNPALDVTQIRTILQAHVAGGGTALTADEAGSGRIDAKDAFDNVP